MSNEFPKNYKARFLLDLYMSNNYMPFSVEDDDREITDSPEFANGEVFNLSSIEYKIDIIIRVFMDWFTKHPEWTEERFLEKYGETIKRYQEAIETGLFCMRKNRIWYHKKAMDDKLEGVEEKLKKLYEKKAGNKSYPDISPLDDAAKELWLEKQLDSINGADDTWKDGFERALNKIKRCYEEAMKRDDEHHGMNDYDRGFFEGFMISYKTLVDEKLMLKERLKKCWKNRRKKKND